MANAIVEQAAEAASAGPGSGSEPDVLILGSADGTLPDRLVDLILDSMTENAVFKAVARAAMAGRGARFGSYPELFAFLKELLHERVRDARDDDGFDPFELLEALNRYRVSVAETLETYDRAAKPNPEAVYWPNPVRYPETSIFTTLPYVEKLAGITKDTPVGSAGSCFAIEIAWNLQQRGFNYVRTESEHEDAKAGVFVDAYDPERPEVSFSANYGLLFNTPSFRQLAEKAFGLRQMPRILLPSSLNTKSGRDVPVYKDPFRESVYFYSYEAYAANYEKHLAAVREAFLKSEYFVVTPGLNECWEYVPDGSVLSRNPVTYDFYPLLRRRTLSVEENVWNLQRMIDIVREHNPDFKVIISISPVPFLATTRASDCHVVVANAHSKAVLRVAAEELVRANRGVYYFPSYEMVTVCTQQPWEPDQRHVNRQAVDGVMRLFDATFVA